MQRINSSSQFGMISERENPQMRKQNPTNDVALPAIRQAIAKSVPTQTAAEKKTQPIWETVGPKDFFVKAQAAAKCRKKIERKTISQSTENSPETHERNKKEVADLMRSLIGFKSKSPK